MGVDFPLKKYMYLSDMALIIVIFLVAYLIVQLSYPCERRLSNSKGRLAIVFIRILPLLKFLIWTGAILLSFDILVGPADDMEIVVWTGFAATLIYALRHGLTQTFSAVFIILQGRVRPGEVIRVEEIRGRVERVGLKGITIQSATGMIHVIPPYTLLTAKVIHEDREQSRPVQLEIPLVDDIDPYEAARVLYEVAAMSPYVDPRVRPEVAIDFIATGPQLSLWARATSLEHERRYRTQVGVRFARELRRVQNEKNATDEGADDDKV
tara:strand:- start:581 stop:1381 length:801 start_codon:yes stop_codon:yes gene_type:complete